jgi:hypothetical protein
MATFCTPVTVFCRAKSEVKRLDNVQAQLQRQVPLLAAKTVPLPAAQPWLLGFKT